MAAGTSTPSTSDDSLVRAPATSTIGSLAPWVLCCERAVPGRPRGAKLLTARRSGVLRASHTAVSPSSTPHAGSPSSVQSACTLRCDTTAREHRAKAAHSAEQRPCVACCFRLVLCASGRRSARARPGSPSLRGHSAEGRCDPTHRPPAHGSRTRSRARGRVAIARRLARATAGGAARSVQRGRSACRECVRERVRAKARAGAPRRAWKQAE
jgi:hypothetical protein